MIEKGRPYDPNSGCGCHTVSGSREVMDSTYPKQKGAFGVANANDRIQNIIALAGLSKYFFGAEYEYRKEG